MMIDDGWLRSLLGTLPAAEARAIGQRLHGLRTDCGCRVGSIVMLGATGFWLARTFAAATQASWQQLLVSGFAVLFVSAGLGKLLGLGLARARFHLLKRGLMRRAQAMRPIEPPMASACLK
jgi:hypothetical protein